MYYTFSQEGVAIRYFWGLKEEAAWNTIVSITFSGGWMSRGAGTPHYHIVCPTDKKQAFFMNGDISATRKTEKLLRKYYKNGIE